MPVRLDLPRALVHWVTPRPWLAASAAEVPAVEFRGWRHPLFLHALPTGDEQELQRFASALSQQPGALVTRALLPASVRATLEAHDVGYLDSRGNLHVVLPTGIIHADAVRGVRVVASSGLGVHGVRAVQEILSRTEPFTVSALANDAQLSLAHTHSVLQVLERNGFLRSSAAGASRLRSVTDRTQLLDWLVSQPVARRRERHLDIALYARRPEDVWHKVGDALNPESIPHALTGSAAAVLFGSGPTAVLTSLVRIDPDVPLEHAAQLLGGSITTRGPNLRLVRDTGRVGTMKADVKNGVRVAPATRIYLDALGERRGEDVANHYREVVLGY